MNDFALVALLGLLGLRIFEACGANIADLGEEHGHRVLRVRGKGGKVVLVPLPPAVARAVDWAVDSRAAGPILRNTLGVRMDRNAATRRLKHLAATAGIRMPRMHPHMLRHTFVTTMLDAGVSLRDVQIAARHADPRTTMRYDRARKNLRNVAAARTFADERTSDRSRFGSVVQGGLPPADDGLGAVGDLKLAEDAGDVVADGAFADKQPGGDVVVA